MNHVKNVTKPQYTFNMIINVDSHSTMRNFFSLSLLFTIIYIHVTCSKLLFKHETYTHTPPNILYNMYIHHSELLFSLSRLMINRGFYMSARVLLNLLNKLRKSDKMRGLPSILSLLRNKFNKFNNTGAQMLDAIYQMTLKLS